MPWYHAFQTNYLLFFIVGLLIWTISFVMTGYEQRLANRSRVAWRSALRGRSAIYVKPSRFQRIRLSKPYQVTSQFIKWQLIPFVLVIAMSATFPYALLVLAIQWPFVVYERSSVNLCKNATGNPAIHRVRIHDFDAADACRRLPTRVVRGRCYVVVITPRQDVNGGRLYDGKLPSK